jgi:hypothetical protein
MYAGGLPAEAQLRAVTVEGTVAVRLRGQRVGDPLHERLRPPPAARRIFNFPSRRLWPRSSATPRPTPTSPTWRAKVRHLPSSTTAPLRPAQITAIKGIEKSLADQHFDRSLVQMATGRRQDLHRGHHGLPPAEVRRVPSHPVPRRPQQPGRADHRRVPELPHPRRRAPLHRDLQRRQAHQRRHARLLRRRRLHDPARLLGAARQEVTEGDDPTSTTSSPTPRSPSPTRRTCRQRRSTSSSSTRPTAPSTACGAGCWSTSTPTSSA